MEGIHLFLVRRERRLRHDLIYFLEALSLHLQCGFELSYSWPETLAAVAMELEPRLQAALHGDGEKPMGDKLRDLAANYPVPSHRMWFSVLAELYSSGAPLVEAVQAISQALRREQSRDLETHCRNLPTKANVCLLLFFLPPTLLLLFVPLVLELSGALAQ
jgi:hypothetical protein